MLIPIRVQLLLTLARLTLQRCNVVTLPYGTRTAWTLGFERRALNRRARGEEAGAKRWKARVRKLRRKCQAAPRV